FLGSQNGWILDYSEDGYKAYSPAFLGSDSDYLDGLVPQH
ncbi:hypothetical protein A2U01_0110081, partial [Trifolium medium]|nr:hypothetical protein [Trifolium medium]